MTYQPTMGLREDLYRITVSVVGTDNPQSTFQAQFDKMDGGDVTSKETKYRPGNGTVNELSLGGANSVSNITVTALMTEAIYGWVAWLSQQSGKAAMYVTKQPLDQNGAAYGKPLVYTGVLTGVTPPKTDASSDAAATITLQQSSVTPIGYN